MTWSDRHTEVLREAAERAGRKLVNRTTRDLSIQDDAGEVLWVVRLHPNGTVHNIRTPSGGVIYIPDYRTHAYTSTPREIRDSFIAAELAPVT